MMYNIKCASVVLGVSQGTVKLWIKKFHIPKLVIETDRKRVFIHHTDLKWLSDKACLQLGNLDEITQRENTYANDELYSIAEVAQFLGVSISAVNKWIVRSGIEKQYIVTDKKRLYITFRDALVLIGDYGRRMWSDASPFGILRSKDREKDLYSLLEAAKVLGVSPETVRRWMDESAIKRKYVTTNAKRLYIRRRDLAKLREKYRQHPDKAEWYSLEDAAQFLGVSLSTVMIWVKKSNISETCKITVQKRLYIQKSEVVKLKEEHRQQPNKEEWYSVEDAVRYLGITRSKVRKLAYRQNMRKIYVITDKKRMYIHKHDIERWKEKGRP